MTADPEKLTERQSDVLRLTKEGKNPTDVAKELGISSQGVHGHLRRLRAKRLLAPDAPKRKGANGRAEVDYLATIRLAAEQAEQDIRKRQSEIDQAIANLQAERDGLNAALEEVRAKLA